ncbi:MAG: SPASM domain-containing protein [Muribaculaceae bacterium]
MINYNGDIYSCTAVDFKSETPAGHIDTTGCMIVDEGFTASRINRRWERGICRVCRIMPLCLGGCSRKILGNDIDHCLCNGDENEKDKVVLAIIKSRVRAMEYSKIIDTFANV